MSCVYFIEAVGLHRVKIGWTTKPAHERVKALKTSSPCDLLLLGTMPAKDQLAEKLVHERFSSIRIVGEWFEKTAELLAFVEHPVMQAVEKPTAVSAYVPKSKLDEWCEQDGRGPSSLAKALGISRATLWRLRAGDHRLTLDTARQIELATAGAVSAISLLGLDRRKPRKREKASA